MKFSLFGASFLVSKLNRICVKTPTLLFKHEQSQKVLEYIIYVLYVCIIA